MMASTFNGKGTAPSLVTLCPRKSTVAHRSTTQSMCNPRRHNKIIRAHPFFCNINVTENEFLHGSDFKDLRPPHTRDMQGRTCPPSTRPEGTRSTTRPEPISYNNHDRWKRLIIITDQLRNVFGSKPIVWNLFKLYVYINIYTVYIYIYARLLVYINVIQWNGRLNSLGYLNFKSIT